ncbi:hypothetical protein M404DRAFT_992634 [Pisolithus tinctorius Marx 270]|uniref:Uncharacterized protein n=1 Tax=Pisolithus tinctorius Marx 270 TaxID=870435 RepID=A0A0C3PYP5_PISTI|nr:hypothetical protein M404DRAFT_992634 [Pisolithus tinctorius Marx 270]
MNSRYAVSYSEVNTLRYSVRTCELGFARRGPRNAFVGSTFSIAQSANGPVTFRPNLDCFTAIRPFFIAGRAALVLSATHLAHSGFIPAQAPIQSGHIFAE